MAEKVKTHPWDTVAFLSFIAAWAIIVMGIYGLPPFPWALISIALGVWPSLYFAKRMKL
jgi:hypothetical protein